MTPDQFSSLIKVLREIGIHLLFIDIMLALLAFATCAI